MGAGGGDVLVQEPWHLNSGHTEACQGLFWESQSGLDCSNSGRGDESEEISVCSRVREVVAEV